MTSGFWPLWDLILEISQVHFELVSSSIYSSLRCAHTVMMVTEQSEEYINHSAYGIYSYIHNVNQNSPQPELQVSSVGSVDFYTFFCFCSNTNQALKRRTERKLLLRGGKSSALSVSSNQESLQKTQTTAFTDLQPSVSACFPWKVTFMCNCAAAYEISLQVIHVETQSAACTNAWL